MYSIITHDERNQALELSQQPHHLSLLFPQNIKLCDICVERLKEAVEGLMEVSSSLLLSKLRTAPSYIRVFVLVLF